MDYKNFKQLRQELEEIEIEKIDYYVDQDNRKAKTESDLEEILTPNFKIQGSFTFDGDVFYSKGEIGLNDGFEYNGGEIYITADSYIGGVEFEGEVLILNDEQEQIIFNILQNKFVF